MHTRQKERHIQMLDDAGNRVVVIETIVLKAVFRSVGPVEIVKERRYTLPGHGHVTRLSNSEFEVFEGHVKLRPAAASQ